MGVGAAEARPGAGICVVSESSIRRSTTRDALRMMTLGSIGRSKREMVTMSRGPTGLVGCTS